jgi:hypothetical protein
MKTVFGLAGVGLALCALAVLEWSYRATHPYALGPSGEIIALGVGGAVVAFVLAAYSYRRERNRDSVEHELRVRISVLEAEIVRLSLDDIELRIDEELRWIEHELGDTQSSRGGNRSSTYGQQAHVSTVGSAPT